MERYEYKAPDGTTRRFNDVLGAQKAYAEAGFKGAIRKVTTPDPFTPEWVSVMGFVAAVIGFGDSADLVVDAAGATVEGCDDEVRDGIATLYDDAEKAQSILGWIAGWAPAEVRDGRVYLVTADVEADDGQTYSDPADEELDSYEDLGDTVTPELVTRTTMTRPPAIVIRDGGPRTVAATTISTVAQDRIREDDRILARIGLVRPSGNYSTNPDMRTAGGYRPGTTCVELGYRNLATARRKWEAQPLTEVACGRIAEAIRAESRRDVTYPAGELRLNDDGTLHTPDGDVPFEGRGFAGYVSHLYGATSENEHGPLFPSASRFLLTLPMDERASLVNRVIDRADIPGGDMVKLRLKTSEGIERVFAAVSESYAPFDGDKVCEVVAAALAGKGYRGEVRYDSESTSLLVDALYHADPKRMTDFAAGDLTALGFGFRAQDNGGGSIRGFGRGFWNGCLNYIVIETGRTEDFALRVVHKGSITSIAAEVAQAVARMQPVFEVFARRWGILAETPVASTPLWGTTFTNGKDALAGMVKDGRFDVGIADKDALTSALHRAYDAEPDDTVAGILRATTRAAHEWDKLLDDVKRDVWERRSGMLVPVLAKFAEASA